LYRYIAESSEWPKKVSVSTDDYMVGTHPKCHAHTLATVPKIPPKYPKSHAQMLAKVPKMPPPKWVPKSCSACPYSMTRKEHDAKVAEKVKAGKYL
jgi:hypothetical protein